MRLPRRAPLPSARAASAMPSEARRSSAGRTAARCPSSCRSRRRPRRARSASVTRTRARRDRPRVVAAQAEAVERRHVDSARRAWPAPARACWRLRPPTGWLDQTYESASPAEVTQLFCRRARCRRSPSAAVLTGAQKWLRDPASENASVVRCRPAAILAHVGVGRAPRSPRCRSSAWRRPSRSNRMPRAIARPRAPRRACPSPMPPTSGALIRPSRPAFASASRPRGETGHACRPRQRKVR